MISFEYQRTPFVGSPRWPTHRPCPLGVSAGWSTVCRHDDIGLGKKLLPWPRSPFPVMPLVPIVSLRMALATLIDHGLPPGRKVRLDEQPAAN